MEQLIAEIEAYAKRRGIKPASVLQYAADLSGNAWKNWLGGAVCTVATAERVRKYMAENPPVEIAEVSLACPPDVETATDENKGVGA